MTNTLVFSVALLIAMATMATPQLTSSEESELLRVHNYFRGRVYPVATNMVKLVRAVQSLHLSWSNW